MYTLIPKEFYVPVTYGDRYGLDIWESSHSRAELVIPAEESTLIAETEKNSPGTLPNNDLYAVIDEEYVNGSVNSALGE